METETAKLGLQVSLAKTKVQNIGYRVQPSSLQVSGKQVQGVRLFEDSAIATDWSCLYNHITPRPDLASLRTLVNNNNNNNNKPCTRFCVDSE